MNEGKMKNPLCCSQSLKGDCSLSSYKVNQRHPLPLVPNPWNSGVISFRDKHFISIDLEYFFVIVVRHGYVEPLVRVRRWVKPCKLFSLSYVANIIGSISDKTLPSSSNVSRR